MMTPLNEKDLLLVAIVNSGKSKVDRLMHLMRSLFFIIAKWKVVLECRHIPGADNGAADALSQILVDHENLVTISCFHTFLIFIQSYIFNFCIYFKCFFSLLVSILFFIKIFYKCMYRRQGRALVPFCHSCTPL